MNNTRPITKHNQAECKSLFAPLCNHQTNEIKEFTNQTEAGEFVGISRQAVYNAIKRGSLVVAPKGHGVYYITKI